MADNKKIRLESDIDLTNAYLESVVDAFKSFSVENDVDLEDVYLDVDGDYDGGYRAFLYGWRDKTPAELAAEAAKKAEVERNALEAARRQMRTLLKKHPQLAYDELNEET